MDLTGKTLAGKYKIIREIGRGGMATVYEAMHLVLDKKVAVKVLHSKLGVDDAFRQRLIREAKASAKLNHPNIIQVYDAEMTDQYDYIVMEAVEGEDLGKIIKKKGALKPERTINIAIQVAGAMDCAHAQGIVHRDIKPQNILLTKDDKVKVTDFGIARAAGAARLTITGATIGTPEYMSPEQAEGEHELDRRSDIYSLGIVMYEMLTGDVPFKAKTPMATLVKHIQEAPRAIKEVLPDIPDSLAQVVHTCLNKDLSKRYKDAASLIKDLELVRAGKAPEFAAPVVTEVKPAAPKLRLRRTMPIERAEKKKEEKAVKKPVVRIKKPKAAIKAIKKIRFKGGPIKVILGITGIALVLALCGTWLFSRLYERGIFQKYGYINVITDPSEFDVYIDDEFIGHTPIKNYKLPVGEHEIMIGSDVYDWGESTRVDIEKNKTEEIKIEVYGFLNVTTDPPEFDVMIDEEYIGITPIQDHKLVAGNRSVVLTKEDLAESVQIYIEKDKTSEIRINMYGYLTFVTEPSGAEVYIREEYIGRTPIRKHKLLEGEYEVELKKGDWRKDYSVSISKGKIEERHEKLEIPEIPGRLKVKGSPSGAKIYIDGKRKGSIPKTIDLDPGRYDIQVKKYGYKDFNKRVTIKPDETETVSVELEQIKGKITVTSSPGEAEIYIDGRYKGKTPSKHFYYKTFDNIKPGKYNVRVFKKNYQEWQGTVTVEVGVDKEGRVDAILKPEPGRLYVTTNPSGALARVGTGMFSAMAVGGAGDKYYTPFTLYDLDPDKSYYLYIKIEYGGYEYERGQHVDIKPGQTTRVRWNRKGGAEDFSISYE